MNTKMIQIFLNKKTPPNHILLGMVTIYKFLQINNEHKKMVEHICYVHYVLRHEIKDYL